MPIRREKWWDERTVFERKLIRLLIFTTTIAIIAFLICLLLITSKNSDTCTTPGCVVAAASLLKNIDFSVDPCDDFYKFACGNFLKNTIVSQKNIELSSLTDSENQLQQNLRFELENPIEGNETRHLLLAKKYYLGCMDEELIEKESLLKVKLLLEVVNGWPVANIFWYDVDFSWLETLYEFRKIGLNSNSLFRITVEQDWNNLNKSIIMIGYPLFEPKAEYLQMNFESPIIQGYYDFMVKIAVIFGANRETAKTQLKQSLLFEINVANHTQDDFSNSYNKMTVHHLETMFPEIPWLDYINHMVTNDAKLNPEEEIVVADFKYIKEVIALIKNTPKRVLANYLIWNSLKPIITFLGETPRLNMQTFYDFLLGEKKTSERWKECVALTQKRLPIAIGALYVRKYFNQDSKKQASEMVHYIKEALLENVKNLDWMDETTHRNVLERAELMGMHVGYPEEIFDDLKLDKYYEQLNIDENDFLSSNLNITIFETNLTFERLKTVKCEDLWINYADVGSVNAFYNFVENTIVLPAGILKGIFFDKDRPHYMNIAAIGSIIGQKIIHDLDYKGSKFDFKEDLTDWWQSTTRDYTLNETNCFIEQYNEISEFNISVNTISENIAYNGGLKLSYIAYKMWVSRHGEEKKLPGLEYTPGQFFWISAAQPWCSKKSARRVAMQEPADESIRNELRVNGAFSNQEQFAEDFRCPKGSKMNPDKRCSLW